MSNDPFDFIGSNSNYHPQVQQDDYSTSFAQQQTRYNYPQAHHQQYSHSHQQNTLQNQTLVPNTRQTNQLAQKRHSVATFGPGGMLVTAFPFIANRFEIVNGKSIPRTLNLSRLGIAKVQVCTKVNDLFNGPLISSFTRKKKSVLELLVSLSRPKLKKEFRDRECAHDLDYLWKLLVILVENDGVLLDERNDPNTWTKIKKIIDFIPIVNSSSTALETIQALLIQGNALGACDYAQATNLWSHALVIATFIDSETYANTLSAFLDYEFSTGVKYQGIEVYEHEELIPLQVIYHLFGNGHNDSLLQVLNSGKCWDWKVVLSIILANPTPNNLTAICSIGDELGKMGLMEAAHFCYLLCFTHSAVNELDLSRLFLISSDHINQPAFFKNYQAIQMTELLEYAKSLNGSTMPHFQALKFAFAMELADLGKTDLAAEYLLATRSILSDYKEIMAEKYKVLLEVVDEMCDRHSVHLNNGAVNGKKHAGWFTKGLDSLMSAAVGETLDDTESKKKARKYSRSNMDMPGSVSGSMHNMARIDSLPAPDMETSQQVSMTSKSESFSYYGGDSVDSNNVNHFYGKSSGLQNYQTTSTNSVVNQRVYSSNYDQTQSLNSYVHKPSGPTPTFSNSVRNDYDGSQQLNQRFYPEPSVKKMSGGNTNDSGNVKAPLSSFGYNTSPRIPTNTPQNAPFHQGSYVPSNESAGPASMYYDNTPQNMIHSTLIPSKNPVINDSYSFNHPRDSIERKYMEQEKFDVTPVDLPQNSVPDNALDTTALKEDIQSKPPPAPEKVDEKKTPAPNQNAPASKSLVNSIWGSLSLFGKSSKDSNAETSGPIKAKLGQDLNCYFDDATGKWVFPDAPQTAEAAPLPPPPQTKAPPPTQNNSAATSRQPSPAPSGAASPAPMSSTPKPTYIGALGGSSRANRRTARSKYVDVLNPSGQSNEPSFDFNPINNFGSAEPKIMKPMFTPNAENTTPYTADQSSYGEKQVPEPNLPNPNVLQEPVNHNHPKSAVAPPIRPDARSPQASRARPNSSNSMQPSTINRNIQNGHRSPAPVRPAGMNRPHQPGVFPPSSGRPGFNPAAPNRSGYVRPINAPNGQPLTNSSAFAGKRIASPNVRPAVARPYRPMNPSSSSRVPDDI